MNIQMRLTGKLKGLQFPECVSRVLRKHILTWKRDLSFTAKTR